MSQARPPLIDALLNPDAYPHACNEIELIETHISWVFLTGDYAYKIKKPLELPFLDFSTLAQRRHFCEEELRLNRRLAPDLYLEVVAIGGSIESPHIGTTPALEYAVKMRQFSTDATLDQQLDTIDPSQIRELADSIAAFHLALPRADSANDAAKAALKNLREVEEALATDQRPALAEISTWMNAELERSAGALGERAAGGASKEGHGDLHLENLAVIGARIVPFDALEFDAALRTVDVIDETAFTVMDFMAHQRDAMAFEFLNRYLEQTGDYAALRVLRLYLVHRALVRAKVHAIAERQANDPRRSHARAEAYLRLAARLVAPKSPLLIITHGLSGSGKTTLTDALIGALPALRVRSDLERKRLQGLGRLERSDSPVGGGLYAADISDATYRALADAAAAGADAGLDMIVDATFLRRAERARFAKLAADAQASFVVLDCDAPESVLRARIEARETRRMDESEAGAAVLDYQLAQRDELDACERRRAVIVDTSKDIDCPSLLARLDAFRAPGDRREARRS